MSTRCTIHFTDTGEDPDAIIYRHSDGYPEGAGADLYRFFAQVAEQTRDTRFDDASYLAAKLVVYVAHANAVHYLGNGKHERAAPLDFLGCGVLMQDPSDIEYRYVVDCSRHDAQGYPVVHCIELRGGEHEVQIPRGAEVPA